MRLLLLTDDKAMGEWIVANLRELNVLVVWVERVADLPAIRAGFQPLWMIWDADTAADFVSGRGDFEGRRIFLIKSELTADFLCAAVSMGAAGYCPRTHMTPALLREQIRIWMAGSAPVVGERFVSRHGVHVDGERQTVRRGSHRLRLTTTEFRILRELIDAPEDTVETGRLTERISFEDPAAPRALYVHICSLRKKLKPLDLKIDSIRGLGYRLKSCPTPRPVLDSGDATSGQI